MWLWRPARPITNLTNQLRLPLTPPRSGLMKESLYFVYRFHRSHFVFVSFCTVATHVTFEILDNHTDIILLSQPVMSL